LDSRENFLAAVFLWITPRATPRAISGCIALSASAASFFLPAATADSTALMKVRMRLIREWLMVDRVALRRIRFLACGVFAMNFLVSRSLNEKAAQKPNGRADVGVPY